MPSELTETEKAFLAFDWSSSQEWLKYFDGLFPTPPVSKVFHFKKKWFKSNVDNKLSMDFSLDGPKPTSSTSSFSSSSSVSPESLSGIRSALRLSSLLLLLLGCVASVLYLVPIVFTKAFRIATLCFVAGFVMEILMKFGAPQLNAAYWQSAVTDESGQSLFMMLASLGIRSWVSLVSPVLASVLFIAQNSNFWLPHLPKALATRANSHAMQVSSNKYQVMQLQANFEVLVGCMSLFMILTGASNILVTVLYWNALRFRYQANPFTQATFRIIDNKIVQWIAMPFCPSLVGSAYLFMKDRLSKFIHH